jgi:hypothetical protein
MNRSPSLPATRLTRTYPISLIATDLTTVGVQKQPATEGTEAPHLAEELLLREDARRIRQQLQQELVLLPRERDGGVADGDAPGRKVRRDRPGAPHLVRGRRGAAEHGADAGQQLLVRERPHEEVVAPALERPHAVDRIGLRLSEHDHGDVAVPCPIFVERGAVPEQDEVRSRLAVDDLKPVAPQMPLEVTARTRLRFGEQERGGHADERSGATCGGLDVLSRKSVTNVLQASA